MEDLNVKPIGIVHSCFKEKFGTPRQPQLIKSARAQIEILPPYNTAEAFEGLETFSHIWVLFCFHKNLRQSWNPRVRPPRLGGNQRIGVFASRSSFRPNNIGMSAVKLEQIEVTNKQIVLHISGQDFIDQTPIIDIKPYIGYADSIPDAECGFAQNAPPSSLEVVFSPSANTFIEDQSAELKLLIEELLAQDPRPAYHEDHAGERIYGIKVENFNVKFTVKDKQALITEIHEFE